MKRLAILGCLILVACSHPAEKYGRAMLTEDLKKCATVSVDDSALAISSVEDLPYGTVFYATVTWSDKNGNLFLCSVCDAHPKPTPGTNGKFKRVEGGVLIDCYYDVRVVVNDNITHRIPIIGQFHDVTGEGLVREGK